MLQLRHPAQVGVDPVGEGALFLLEDHVVAVTEVAWRRNIQLNQSTNQNTCKEGHWMAGYFYDIGKLF